jgi:plastocyanin
MEKLLMRFVSSVFTTTFILASSTMPAFAATHMIAVGPSNTLTFSPATITIAPGDTITFQSNASIGHDVVSDDGTTFSSGAPVPGPWTLVTPPLTAGTYGFHCTVHGAPGSGMFGTITVQATPVTLQSFEVN